jgi:hypothetical protein
MKKLNKLVDKFIKEEAREEAKEILRRSIICDIKDFSLACHNNQSNVACLILDHLKDKLVKQKKVKKGGYFGNEKI